MQDYYDFLIDKALDMKDFEWVKELQQSKDKYENIEYIEKINNDNKNYSNRITVLEDMINNYGNLTDRGIININFQSKDNILSANIIACKKKYKKGQIAKYKSFDEYEQVYIKGYWIGYLESIGLSNNTHPETLSYDKGYLKGWNECANIYTTVIDKMKNTDEKPIKKWWMFWK